MVPFQFTDFVTHNCILLYITVYGKLSAYTYPFPGKLVLFFSLA